MHAALKDGVSVAAGDFYADSKRLGADWLARNRKGFTCQLCGEAASFVSPALGSSGRVAHFRVTGSTECLAHRPTAKKPVASGQDSETREGVINEGGVIDVRYTRLAGPGTVTVPPKSSNPPAEVKGTVQYFDGGGTSTSRSELTLQTFLTYLVSHDSYPPSTMQLNIPERGQVFATDYFCRFEYVTPAHAEPLPGEGKNQSRLMAYWGKIDAVSIPGGGGSLFLNGANMDVMIPPKYAGELEAAVGFKHFEKLTGWHVIVAGRLETNAKGGLLLKVKDLDRIALHAPQ